MFVSPRPIVSILERPLSAIEGQDRLEVVKESYRSDITPLDRFDKDAFKLLVHAYNPVMARGFVEEAKENGTYDPKKDINLLKNPERLREKGLVSASIITAEHLPTFARLLFIIGFDPNEILATSPKDGSYRYKEKEFLANPPGPTLTVDELVEKTKPDEHNEIVLKSENLKILGVAVKHMVKNDGVIDTPAFADDLRALARDRGFPVLELHQPCLLEDKVEVGTDKNGVVRGAVVHHNGVGYTLSERWQQRYFHPIQCDWEDISETEYKELKRILKPAVEGQKGGSDFLDRLDAKMRERFQSEFTKTRETDKPQRKGRRRRLLTDTYSIGSG